MVAELVAEEDTVRKRGIPTGELGCNLVSLLNMDIPFGLCLLMTIRYDEEELCLPMMKWFYWLHAHFGSRTIIVCPQQAQIIIACDDDFPDELLFYCTLFVDYPRENTFPVRAVDGHFYTALERQSA
jgi:hypothetical protein